jgi:hypothetical protein
MKQEKGNTGMHQKVYQLTTEVKQSINKYLELKSLFNMGAIWEKAHAQK